MDYVLDSFADVNSSLKQQQRKLVSKLPAAFSRTYIDKTTRDNALIERIISILPNQSTKNMPDLIGLSGSKEKKVIDYLLEFDWLSKAKKLGYLANKYGAAYLLLDIDDKRDISLPVDRSKRPPIVGTYTLIQENCYPDVEAYDSWSFDDPEYFVIYRNGQCEKVHASRLLCFYGKKLYGQSLCDNNMKHRPAWFDCFPALEHYDRSLQATLDMLSDAEVFIYKYKGLHDLLESAKQLDGCNDANVTKQLVNRLRALVDCRSLTNSMIFDMDNEDAEYKSRDYSNVDNMVKTLRLAFAERTGLPQSVLFSSSESGLFSDSGESDRYFLASLVNKYQREQHTSNLRKLIGILDFRIKGYQIDYPSTVEATAQENAETIFTLTKALSALTVAGILTQSQAAAYFGEKSILTHVQLTEAEIKAADNNEAKGGAEINTNVSGNHKEKEGSTD